MSARTELNTGMSSNTCNVPVGYVTEFEEH